MMVCLSSVSVVRIAGLNVEAKLGRRAETAWGLLLSPTEEPTRVDAEAECGDVEVEGGGELGDVGGEGCCDEAALLIEQGRGRGGAEGRQAYEPDDLNAAEVVDERGEAGSGTG